MDVTSAQDRRDVDGYAGLRAILDEAYDQSARGKGSDRHANGRAFENQPILEIGRMVGPGFATGQVMKKAQEATTMAARGDDSAAVRELLGVIVYAASAVLLLREKDADRRREKKFRTDIEALGLAHVLKPPTPPASYEEYARRAVADGHIHVDQALLDWFSSPGAAEFASEDIERRRASSKFQPFDTTDGGRTHPRSYLAPEAQQPAVGETYEWLGLVQSQCFTVGHRYGVETVDGKFNQVTVIDDNRCPHIWSTGSFCEHFRRV